VDGVKREKVGVRGQVSGGRKREKREKREGLRAET
jgi:hypothetical protein